jgi:hypothetical protein
MRATSDAGSEAWARLGGLLEQRRVQMRPAWKNLALFTRERDIDWRLAWDLENARRTNYRRPTLRAAEVAYGWAPGSIDAVLRGQDPVPSDQQRVEDDSDPRPRAIRDLVTIAEWEEDSQIQTLWQLQHIPAGARVGIVSEYMRARENASEAEVTHLRRAAR